MWQCVIFVILIPQDNLKVVKLCSSLKILHGLVQFSYKVCKSHVLKWLRKSKGKTKEVRQFKNVWKSYNHIKLS